MGLIRILILALVIWLIWRLYQIHKRKTAARQGNRQSITGGKMVRCAQCGTHLPEENALPQDERWFCCKAHRDAHEQE